MFKFCNNACGRLAAYPCLDEWNSGSREKLDLEDSTRREYGTGGWVTVEL